MQFHILTIFPEIFTNNSYFDYSILKRAQEKKIIAITPHNLRDFADDAHNTVDSPPYGGGPGMVLKIEPVYRCVQSLSRKLKVKNEKFRDRIILFSTRGKRLDEKAAARLAKYQNLILICGRYEGVDERVAKHIADEELSIGDYTLAGGELPAMVLIEAVARFVPGVLGKKESLETIKGSYPAYTRPEVFSPDTKKKWRVPKILFSGDHKKIESWRKKKSPDNPLSEL